MTDNILSMPPVEGRTYIHELGGIIEIAPRASGKTARLVDAAISHIRESSDNHALIFVPILHNKRSMRNRINEKIQDLSMPFATRNQAIIHSMSSFNNVSEFTFNHLSSINNNKLFFDDFELPRFSGPDELPFIPTAYYTGTPVVNVRQSNTYRWMQQISDSSELEGRESFFISHYINLTDIGNDFGSSPLPLGRTPEDRVPDIEIESVRVDPMPRALRGRWTVEQMVDLESIHDINIDQEMTNIADQPRSEVDDQPRSEVDDYLDRIGI